MVSLLFYSCVLFFPGTTYAHRELYGGISMLVAGAAGVSAIALSNVSDLLHTRQVQETDFLPQRSYTWSRVTTFLWPFVIVICAIRVTVMIVEFNRG